MTSEEAYKSFLIKINKNDSNRNIKIPKGQFVLLYNQQAPIWLKNRLEEGHKTDRLDDLAELLELDKSLEKVEEFDKSVDFKLPDDFFDYSSSYSLATTDECSEETVLYHWNYKNKNKNTLLINENTKPSFDYQETFITQNKNLIKVYTDNFTIKKVFLDYYRVPPEIDILGYINTDGSNSINKNPILDKYLVNQIINYCVLETVRIYQSPEDFQLSKERIEKEI